MAARNANSRGEMNPTMQDPPRNRLPNLFEVLARRTLAPVDLFFFYIFMRDQQRSVDYLDFWLDVAQHMSMCRHYVRELRRSVMVDTPNGDMAGSKRSSVLLENMGPLSDRAIRPPMLQSEKENNQDAAMSQFLREDVGNTTGSHHSPAASNGSEMRRTSSIDRPRPSFMSSPQVQTSDSNSPEQRVARQDIRASAEHILYTYLLPGAEREISFSTASDIPRLVTIAIEEDGRDDPEVFDAAKDYVFQAMERDAFRQFIDATAFGNMVPTTLMIRVVVGLLVLFGSVWGFSIAMLLGASRETKLWCILPFTVGTYLTSAWIYHLDPILALLGYSEYEFCKFSKVLEPYIRKIHIRRGLMVLAVIIVLAAAQCIAVIIPETHHI